MAVYYYQKTAIPGTPGAFSYFRFGGSFKAIMSAESALNVAEQVYADFQDLDAPFISAWVYAVLWNAVVSQPTEAAARSSKVFESIPSRYSFGHATTYDTVGVAWDSTLKFEDQKIPLHRTHIIDGNPNPGGIPVDFDTPLEAVSVIGWEKTVQTSTQVSASIARANTLGLFLTSAPEAIVTFNYYCQIIFDAADIIVQNPIVGVFP